MSLNKERNVKVLLSDKESMEIIRNTDKERLQQIQSRARTYYWIDNQLVVGPFDPEDLQTISKDLTYAFSHKLSVTENSLQASIGMWFLSRRWNGTLLTTSWINFSTGGITAINYVKDNRKVQEGSKLIKDIKAFQLALTLIGVNFDPCDLSFYD